MPREINQESQASTPLGEKVDSAPEDIREVFHDLLGIKRKLNRLKSFYETRQRIKNGDYLFDFNANQIKQENLMGPLTFNIYSSTIAGTIALFVTKIFNIFFPDNGAPVIAYDANSVMGQYAKFAPHVESFLRPFLIPVIFLFLAYVISWGTIRVSKPTVTSIASDSPNKLLPSKIRGRNAFLYFDGAYGLIPQMALSLAMSIIFSLPVGYLLVHETTGNPPAENIGPPAIDNSQFVISRLIWIDIVAAIAFAAALIYQGYLTYYRFPTLLFKAHGYYSANATRVSKPPWFKYILTAMFVAPVVSISIYFVYMALVFIVSILLAAAFASVHRVAT